jgi:hypothetical protein
LILFNIENQLVTFKYLHHEFSLVLDIDRCIDEVESELKYKAGMSEDVRFYGFGNRQIQKGEYLYEHPTITLKKINERAEVDECQLVDISLNEFVGNINVKTNIKCFNGWNRRGLGNHIGKVLGLKNGIFRI